MNRQYEYAFQQKLKWLLEQDKTILQKYCGAGIYSISIGEQLVYIGKAKSLLKRLVEHLLELDAPRQRTNKYIVLNEARKSGHRISFDVMYHATSNSEKEIGIKESELINKLLPPLNYQIPKMDNFRNFTTNPKALTITLEEILKEGEQNEKRITG